MSHDPTTRRRIAARTGALTGLTLLVLAGAGAGSASAQEAEAAAAVEVAVTGPSTGEAGGTGEFAVAVRNTESRPVRDLALRPQLPEGVTVRSVGVSDSWTCTLGPLRCSLDGQLRAGATTQSLPVELHYDGLVEGRQEIAFVVVQDKGGAVRNDRGAIVVDVEPEPEPEPQPEQPPAAQPPAQQAPPPAQPAPVAAAPAPAAPAPAAPAPAAPAPAAPAPAAQPTSEAPAPAPALDEPAPEDVPAAEAAEQDVPETLPFADTDTEDQDAAASSDESDASTVAASNSSGISDIYTALLALVFTVLLVAFLYLTSRVVAQRRGQAAA